MIELKNSKGKITVDLNGAYVMSYVPTGGREVLFAADCDKYGKRQWRNQGIPISWPWFDDMCENPKGKPIHGLAWNMKWQVVSQVDGDGFSKVVLATESSHITQKLWPYDFKLRYAISLGSALTMRLTTMNCDEMPMTITTGFHPYFAVSSLKKAHILGLGIDDDEITPGYHRFIPANDLQATIRDDGWKREISVSSRGTRQAVVWNCGNRKKNFVDLKDEDVDKFLCLEPQAIPAENAITIGPGRTNTIEMAIAVK